MVVAVIAPVIVGVHVQGNDTVDVIATLDDVHVHAERR